MSQPNLRVSMPGFAMKNPVTTASGTFGYGSEFAPYMDIASLGALTVKALTLEPRPGNSGRRLIETPAGLINSIGLMNPGLEVFLASILPELRLLQDLPLIVNISGSSVAEYAALAERLDAERGIAALEVNISCPNVKEGGMAFGHRPDTAAEVTAAVRAKTKLPMFVKLTPNTGDIASIAQAVEAAGADGLSLINTVLAMSIDIRTRRPVLDGIMGGLSGPAIMPIALSMVYRVHQRCKLPIIGMGGISTWQDALQFIMAGASAVAVGTANFVNPSATIDIIAGLEAWCEQQQVSALSDIIGAAHMK